MKNNVTRKLSRGPFKQAALIVVAGLLCVEMPNALANQTPRDEITEEIKNYCSNIADAARDQRYLRQKIELETLQTEVNERITILEDRRAKYEEWLRRRNVFLKQAEQGLVEIYKNMPSDAAAQQLAIVDIEVAAAIVMKLQPRLASKILAEMEPKVAAGLTGIIASAADPTTPGDPA